MTRYEYYQNQIDNITNMELEIYYNVGSYKNFYILENMKAEIRNKQLNLTIKNGEKKANLFYRIFN